MDRNETSAQLSFELGPAVAHMASQAPSVAPTPISSGSGPARVADQRAVEAWIAARCDEFDRAHGGQVSHTARAYRREARRFLLWLGVERGRSLADAAIEDCIAYRNFLADPQPAHRWCAPRGRRIGSPGWRPFEGPLSPRACRQAMVILQGLYRFLQDQGYLVRNPWSGVAPPRYSAPRLDPGRSLDEGQWAAVLRQLEREPTDFASRQLAWAVRLLYATGLRLSEVVQARCGDLRQVPLSGSVEGAGAWVLRVLGKGQRLRDVPVSTSVVEAFGTLLAHVSGQPTDPLDHDDRPLLIAPACGAGQRGAQVAMRPLSAQQLYRQLKRLFARTADGLEGQGRRRDAQVLKRASTHWLRHTHGTHCVRRGVAIDVVQQNLGHASLSTTSVYVHAGLDRRIIESRRLTVEP